MFSLRCRHNILYFEVSIWLDLHFFFLKSILLVPLVAKWVWTVPHGGAVLAHVAARWAWTRNEVPSVGNILYPASLSSSGGCRGLSQARSVGLFDQMHICVHLREPHLCEWGGCSQATGTLATPVVTTRLLCVLIARFIPYMCKDLSQAAWVPSWLQHDLAAWPCQVTWAFCAGSMTFEDTTMDLTMEACQQLDFA